MLTNKEDKWESKDTLNLQTDIETWRSKDKWNFKTICYIKLANKDTVLGITNENEVIDNIFVPNDNKQMWIVGPTNNKGYFTLINLHSQQLNRCQQLLTANSSDEFEITGMSYQDKNSNYQLGFQFSFFFLS